MAAALLFLTRDPAMASDCTGALSSASAIQTAMKNAAPGTTIRIKPGTYVGLQSTSGNRKAHFYSAKSGTSAAPIVLRSCEPGNPVILKGSDPNDSSYVFYLTGDHWVVEDVVVSSGTKGIVLDAADHNVLRRVEVHSIGDEGIHIRCGSSYTLVEQCYIHDTGLVRPGYGEGVYVGSDSVATYTHEVIGNVIRSTFFTRVGGEHIDIKEGADGTLVEYCTFDGTGMSGEHFADSFVDVKGVNSILRNNVGYRRGNTRVLDAFQVRLMPGAYASGLNNTIHNNIVDLDDGEGYVVRVLKPASGTACFGNVRVGGGQLYTGLVSTLQPVAATDDGLPTGTLSLAGFLPNPARAPEGIAFVLASSQRASIEILDVAGRRIFSREVGSLGPGRHVLGREVLPHFEPGVYMLSLLQSGERRTARGVILH